MRLPHLLPILTASTTVASICPFLGPVFPAPKSLSAKNPIFATLRSTIESALTSGNTSHGPVNANDTYSIQIFSRSDKGVPLLDFHHRGTDVQGNSTVNGNSIYRIASTTKLLTVYLLLLQAGDAILNDPVVKYLPELKGKGEWDDITVGALAGYMGGIVGEGEFNVRLRSKHLTIDEVYDTDLLTGGGLGAAFPNVFPELKEDEMSPCAYGREGCTREVFLEHLVTRKQVFLPNTTPAYNNAGFAILGLLLESLTGLSYADSLSKLLAIPLKLTSTTATTPPTINRGVIITSETASGWDTIIDGPSIAMGAAFSSANDLSTLGRAILSSSLLPPNTTRAWLKPTSHTSSLIGAVGQPWEIFRASMGENRVVDLYTKGGNFGAYGANFVLVPDFEVGFVVLKAGARGQVPVEMSGLIIDELIPACEEAARIEAEERFAGTYSASHSKSNSTSTIKITSTPGTPGLTVSHWAVNGTDVLQDIFGSPKHFQLFPTNADGGYGGISSWRGTYISLDDVGAFSACPSWFGLDRPTYGVYALDEFVFRLDGGGRAWGVELLAFGVLLGRE
ncbi:hypothetical protein HBH98_097380 [Parastagonospora nodorum]|nr:hypothetical protein HBH53_062680 [Parastagonospora nodorum]KAH3975623.1 hypothetical protein HBH52_124170 [Parastagonospora nodorum]KAH3978821.1 hypothetical protein HBH51_061110 [Parastagonospora nodorum]KAH3999198.1 hypothetical protein HBI10_117770 [Parastagonospora nodorum]KAH4025256.1 hypothetical protein HBI13_079420 [Parastagonospora nodorum]